MKFLIIGLGSMGKRRIRNLKKIGQNKITGFDVRKDRRDEARRKYQIETYEDVEEAINQKPNLIIISTPPDLHLKYVKIAIKNKIPFFTELNLISKDVKKIITQLQKSKVKGFPSCTFFFHPVVIKLKQLVEKNAIGKVILISHHTGQYLPNWHPWEDYRKIFLSKKETGGAKEILAIDSIWLSNIFGKIKKIKGVTGKLSKLQVDIDDFYSTQIIFEKKIFCNLLIDVMAIPSIKETKIIGEKGTIYCNFKNGKIIILNDSKTKIIKNKIGNTAKGYKGITSSEKVYELEIKHVIKSLQNKEKFLFSFKQEFEILKNLESIKNRY